MKTKIEWTDETWNPVVGCTKVSQGCKHCYAERIFERFNPGKKFTDVQMIPGKLQDPLHWKKPRRVFVNSMSDLFHEKVAPVFIMQAWRTMQQTSQHTYQILTKRPERMQMLLTEWLPFAWELAYLETYPGPLPNVWLGVSAEDQNTADERIPLLLKTPAALRFVSCEPLLGPVNLDTYLGNTPEDDDGAPYPGKIDWVIVGGESGPGARPMHPDWARSIRDQCHGAQVSFFFKQWGEWLDGVRVGKKNAGSILDGRGYKEFPL